MNMEHSQIQCGGLSTLDILAEKHFFPGGQGVRVCGEESGGMEKFGVT